MTKSKLMRLTALLVFSPAILTTQPAQASIFCGTEGSVRWEAAGKPIWDFYNLKTFEIESKLTLLKEAKTISGIARRSNGGAITFSDPQRNVGFTIRLNGSGEGYVASLFRHGKSVPCGLY